MKNKIIPIILLMLVIFTFVMSTSVFALSDIVTFDASLGDKKAIYNIELNDTLKNYKYIYMFSDSRFNDDWFGLTSIITNDELIITDYSGGMLYFDFKDGENHPCYYFSSNGSYFANFTKNNDYTMTIYGSRFSSNNSLPKKYCTCTKIDNNYALYSNTELKNKNGDVVFQVAPQVEELTSTIAISTDYSMVLMEILGILPIVLVVVIGLLALRKAIQLLSTMLHHA